MIEIEDKKERMAGAVLLVVTSRERAPRSPAMERALKRLIWRYSRQPLPPAPGAATETAVVLSTSETVVE